MHQYSIASISKPNMDKVGPVTRELLEEVIIQKGIFDPSCIALIDSLARICQTVESSIREGTSKEIYTEDGKDIMRARHDCIRHESQRAANTLLAFASSYLRDYHHMGLTRTFVLDYDKLDGPQRQSLVITDDKVFRRVGDISQWLYDGFANSHPLMGRVVLFVACVMRGVAGLVNEFNALLTTLYTSDNVQSRELMIHVFQVFEYETLIMNNLKAIGTTYLPKNPINTYEFIQFSDLMAKERARKRHKVAIEGMTELDLNA